jgi:hypothetical protein
MENIPQWSDIERVVVEPIANGILITISTEIDEQQYSFKTYRQILSFMKALDKKTQ